MDQTRSTSSQYHSWFSISHNNAQAKTSQEAWTILANTYAKPSRGRIKQVAEPQRVLRGQLPP